jgi:hypothetical protein
VPPCCAAPAAALHNSPAAPAAVGWLHNCLLHCCGALATTPAVALLGCVHLWASAGQDLVPEGRGLWEEGGCIYPSGNCSW